MNRPFVYRQQKIAGVYQRCNRDCPANRCAEHRWAFHIELPAGPDGRRRQVTKGGFQTGREAMKAREEVGTADRDGKISANPRTTFAGWSAEWLAGKIERGELKPSSARAHTDALRLHLVPQLGRYKLTELTGYHLTRAYGAILRDRRAQVAEATKDGRKVPPSISPASIVRMHGVVSGCLRSAEKAGLVPRNVAPHAELPTWRPTEVRPWTPDQARQFLDWLDRQSDRLAPLIHLAVHTGLRRGELLALGWADVDLDTGTARVWRQRVTVAGAVSVVDHPKTRSGERTVPLFPGTVAVLRQWRAQQNRERLAWEGAWNDRGWVFTHEDGKPLFPDTVGRVFAKRARQAELPPLRFHDLRHTFASIAADAGVPIEMLSKVMGHANVRTTLQLYAHLYPETHRRVADLVGEKLASRAATG
ncbi:site-specific integrase [Micromonospora sp. LH3U1]|uniref:site-specific integrase n=1 Tax=Micromonospora sp. LH3U1 TaxID=3018339 RepID=UPI00234B08A0|nr:site-specific integrase [Micromonospora sp. LH3U1]WCN80037.1 tyrosine-type recombinase/integrase [Micromonospora sp. LH3U1]